MIRHALEFELATELRASVAAARMNRRGDRIERAQPAMIPTG